MIRRKLLLGLSLFLGTVGYTFAEGTKGPAPIAVPSDPPAVSRVKQAVPLTSESVRLSPASEMAALHYPWTLTDRDILDRVEADAEALGLDIIRTMVIGNVAVFNASPETLRERLKAVETIPASHVSPVYFPPGTLHPEQMVVFTSRLIVEFDPTATEAEKEQWYAANGYTRLRELASGRVLLDTNIQPGVAMLDLATQMPTTTRLVKAAEFDVLLNAEQAFDSNSIILKDTLYPFQWYLENTRLNTNYQFGIADEDIDAPRAWQINQQYGAPFKYGSPSVVVGIFDSGIQTNPAHADLGANIDPRIGLDSYDGGPPTPTQDLLGAHGTAMASLVAADNNNTGIVGVAPDVRLYISRVLGEDYGANVSASSAAIVTGLEDSIFQGIDVNLHGYTLSVTLSGASFNDSLVQNIERALRQSFESGRAGLGTTNLAPVGNFYSQIGYPASSFWTFAVGSVTADETVAAQTNWGGVGPDFSMPGYDVFGIDNSAFTGSFGTGILVADLPGAVGISASDPFTEGNKAGEYGALGRITGFTASSARNSRRFLGSSVSTALAAGVVAMMYSDSRYNELPPFIWDEFEAALPTRNDYRNRYAFRPDDSSILAKLRSHSDLPDVSSSFESVTRQFTEPSIINDLAYVFQNHERVGFGRPNAARLMAVPGDFTPDSLYPQFVTRRVYDVTFGLGGDWGILEEKEETAEIWESLAQGWNAGARALRIPANDEIPATTISPYLEAVQAIYFEDGSVVRPRPPEDPPFFYVWTDSLTTAPEGTDDISDETIPNYYWNPEGQYWANQRIDLEGPDINTTNITGDLVDVSISVPLILTLQIGHELGVENVSDVPRSIPVDSTDRATPRIEVDAIRVYVKSSFPPPFPGGDPVQQTLLVGEITGDSSLSPKRRLEAANPVLITEPSPREQVFPQWRGTTFADHYDPLVPESEMLVRTYRFLVPPLDENADDFSIMISLQPGSSVLPVWYFDDNRDATQVFDAQRDSRGFILYSVAVDAVDGRFVDYLDRNNFAVGFGYYPTFTASMNDIMVTQAKSSGGDFLSKLHPFPNYIIEPESVGSGTGRREFQRIMESRDTVTGLKAHPFYEILAMTASGPGGDGVYTISPDGVNQTEVVDPSLSIGAREPSWANNGQQMIYCSEDYIRIINFLPDGEVEVETPLNEDHPFLTDFHSPVFDPSGGFFYFVARRKAPAADTSLNVYVASRNGRILGFDFDANNIPFPLLREFEGIDVYDLDISLSGKRLVFTANADVTFSIEDSLVIDTATPSPDSKLFTCENLDWVTLYNDPALYTQIQLEHPENRFEQSSRWGRLSPDNGELVWVGFEREIDVNSLVRTGEIVRQPIGAEFNGAPINVPDPTPPTPTPTPTPTPILIDNAKVTQTGLLEFDYSEEGWDFNTGGFTSNPAIFGYDQLNGLPREVAPGIVGFFAGSNEVVSEQQPGIDPRVATLNFVALKSGVVGFDFSTIPPRVTVAQDFFFNDLDTEIGRPPAKNMAVEKQSGPAYIYYDLVAPATTTVSPGQLVTIRVRVDPNGLPVQTVEAYVTFDDKLLSFESGLINDTLFDRQVSQGALVLQSNNTNSVFGYWESRTKAIQTREDSLFLLRALVTATAGTADNEVPTLRMRVNTNNLESAFTVEANSFGDLSLSPTASEARPVDLLFRPPADLLSLLPSKRDYMIAFDLLNFLPEKDANGGLRLEEIQLYRMDDNRKYYAIWGFEVPSGGAIANFQIFGTTGVDGRISASMRRCCADPDSSISCVTGSLVTGVNLDFGFLESGFYTIVAVADRNEDIALTWSSNRGLLANFGDDCGSSARQAVEIDPAEYCEDKVLISGNGNSQISIQSPFYDGLGFFPELGCDPKPNETVVKSFDVVYEADFDTQDVRDTWVQGPLSNPYVSPIFGVTNQALTLAVADRNLTFGYWNAEGNTIPTGTPTTSLDSPVLIYRGIYRVTLESSDVVDPLAIPDIRVRLSTNEFQRSVSGLLVSATDGATVPTSGDPTEIEIYLVLENVPTSMSALISAFDVLSFYPESVFPQKNITNRPIELELVRIERVHIPNYPLP